MLPLMISNFYIKLFKVEKICDASTITSCFFNLRGELFNEEIICNKS